MEIHASVVADKKLLLASCRASYRGLYVGALVVAGLVVVLSRDVSSFFFAAAYLLFIEWVFRRQVRPWLVGDRTTRWTVTEDEYRVEGPDRSVTLRWSAIRRVRRVGRFWVFRLGALEAAAMPVAALEPAEAAEFEAFVRERGLLRA